MATVSSIPTWCEAEPAKGEDATGVRGGNGQILKPEQLTVSNASCPTNYLAPMVKALYGEFGGGKGMMNTIHSYVNDQP